MIGGIAIIIIGGGILLVIFLFKKKKRRTKSVGMYYYGVQNLTQGKVIHLLT